jgi:hypothetical protein
VIRQDLFPVRRQGPEPGRRGSSGQSSHGRPAADGTLPAMLLWIVAVVDLAVAALLFVSAARQGRPGRLVLGLLLLGVGILLATLALLDTV